MIYGIDVGMLLFLGVYSCVTILAITVGCIKVHEKMTEKKKPKLKVIQGGKKDGGPYGKNR